MSNKLYVENLSFDTTELDLQDHFAQAGTVQQAELMQDRFTGKSRGFGFVTMSTDDEAEKAISLFHGKDFMSRSLTVNTARLSRTGPEAARAARRVIPAAFRSVTRSCLVARSFFKRPNESRGVLYLASNFLPPFRR